MDERQGRLLALYIVAFIVLGVAAAAMGAGVFRQVLGGALFGGLIGGVAFGVYKYKIKDKIEWVLGVSFFLLLMVVGWSDGITKSARTQSKKLEQKGPYSRTPPYSGYTQQREGRSPFRQEIDWKREGGSRFGQEIDWKWTEPYEVKPWAPYKERSEEKKAN